MPTRIPLQIAITFALVLGFSPSSVALSAASKVGIKEVETQGSFSITRAGQTTTISSFDPEVPELDRKWSWWLHSLQSRLLGEWEPEYPGEARVILRVTPDRQIKIGKISAFVPQSDQLGSIDTSDRTRKLFLESIERCLQNVSSVPDFPNSNSLDEQFESAALDMTFCADRHLFVWTKDLAVLEQAPKDDKSQWTARICTILDAGFLYKESGELKKRLPESMHVAFLPQKENHLFSPSGYGQLCTGFSPSRTNHKLGSKASKLLVQTLRCDVQRCTHEWKKTS